MAELSSKFEGDRIVIVLDPGEPIELSDLSSSFAALARIYERHYRRSGDTAPKLYVTKMETGSVWAEIAPYATIMGGVALMDSSVIVADFTNRLWRGIKSFATPTSDVPAVGPTSAEDARDLKEFTKPLLGKNGSHLGIKHARYEKRDGEKFVIVEYDFDEAELNRAAVNIDKALEPPTIDVEVLQERAGILNEVMLFFDQANRAPGKHKGRTGDRGIIPEVSKTPLPVYFRKSFQNLKDQMVKGEVNPLGHLEEPPPSRRFLIHCRGDLREAADAGTGGVLGH